MLDMPYPMQAGYPRLQPMSPQLQQRNRIAMQLIGRPQGSLHPATMQRQSGNPIPPPAAPQLQLQQQMQPYGELLGNYLKPEPV
jgi:hypothetical protein